MPLIPTSLATPSSLTLVTVPDSTSVSRMIQTLWPFLNTVLLAALLTGRLLVGGVSFVVPQVYTVVGALARGPEKAYDTPHFFSADCHTRRCKITAPAHRSGRSTPDAV